jgi:hypothetical protein
MTTTVIASDMHSLRILAYIDIVVCYVGPAKQCTYGTSEGTSSMPESGDMIFVHVSHHVFLSKRMTVSAFV